MLSKPRKTKAAAARRAPARKTATKTKTPKAEFSREEVEVLADQLERHQASERAWQRLAGLDETGEDRWSAVEEHLLSKDQQSQHAERRWKYFAK